MCDICEWPDVDDAIFGELITKRDVTVHYYCLLSGSDIPQNGRDTSGIHGFLIHDIKNSILKFKNNECYLCGKKSAAVSCNHPGCTKTWHYICGRRNTCITQFTDEFNSYCGAHLPDTNAFKHNIPVFCYVCFELIYYHPARSLFSNCCAEAHKHTEQITLEKMLECGFVHAICAQRYLHNAGYDSMCISCPMKEMTKEEYQHQMRLKGVFIPMKKATWEDDEYFKKMTKNKCENKNCKDTKSKDVWTCFICGCFPSHLKCAKVNSFEEYYCPKCYDQSFVQRVPKNA